MAAALETPSVLFAGLHLQIRNDDHCPKCRRWFVTFCSERASACSTFKLEDEDAKQLKESSQVWVDEWVRRQNGDQYFVVPVTRGTEWNLTKFESISTKPVSQQEAKFMTLSIAIDHKQECPDNIEFQNVAFFPTAEAAAKHLSGVFSSAYFVSAYQNGAYRSEELEVDSKEVEANMKKWQSFEPVWKQFEEHAGTHFQIVPIQTGVEIELNSLCPQLDAVYFGKQAQQFG